MITLARVRINRGGGPGRLAFPQARVASDFPSPLVASACPPPAKREQPGPQELSRAAGRRMREAVHGSEADTLDRSEGRLRWAVRRTKGVPLPGVLSLPVRSTLSLPKGAKRHVFRAKSRKTRTQLVQHERQHVVIQLPVALNTLKGCRMTAPPRRGQSPSLRGRRPWEREQKKGCVLKGRHTSLCTTPSGWMLFAL